MRFVLIAASALSLAMPVTAQPATTLPLLVTPAWMLEHRTEPGLVLVHVGSNRREFQRSHADGAKFVWYETIAPSNADASTELPHPAAMREALESLGITDGSRIVLTYTDRNLTSAARMLWTLEVYGMAGRVAIVTGGNDALKAAGYPMTSGMPAVPRGRVTLSLDASRTADAPSILATLAQKTVALVDVRLRTSYDGSVDALRSGHIPGAMSLPSGSLLDSLGRLKGDAALREQFVLSAVDTTKPIVVYCAVGQSASLGYLAARTLGYRVAMYDGSFQDWNLHGEEYPVVSPPPKR